MQNISEQEFATKHQWLVVAVVVVVSMICIVAVFACCSAAVIAAGTGAAPLLLHQCLSRTLQWRFPD